MQSMASNVDQYLEEVPEKRRAALVQLRALCVETLTGYEETMEYRMPSYKRISPEGRWDLVNYIRDLNGQGGR